MLALAAFVYVSVRLDEESVGDLLNEAKFGRSAPLTWMSSLAKPRHDIVSQDYGLELVASRASSDFDHAHHQTNTILDVLRGMNYELNL